MDVVGCEDDSLDGGVREFLTGCWISGHFGGFVKDGSTRDECLVGDLWLFC